VRFAYFIALLVGLGFILAGVYLFLALDEIGLLTRFLLALLAFSCGLALSLLACGKLREPKQFLVVDFYRGEIRRRLTQAPGIARVDVTPLAKLEAIKLRYEQATFHDENNSWLCSVRTHDGREIPLLESLDEQKAESLIRIMQTKLVDLPTRRSADETP